MYNLAIALGAAVVLFGIGWLSVSWVAGFVPALIALVGVYFYLARRTGKQLETIFGKAMVLLQQGQIDAGRALLKEALPLAPWQFLVSEQVYSQLAQLDYQQACGHLLEHKYTRDAKKKALGEEKLAEALTQAEKAWSRDWRGQMVRALCLYRLGRADEVGKVLEAASGGGNSEALFWGTWAWVLNEQKKREEALQIVGRGLQAQPKSVPLLGMQEAFTNKRRPDMEVFGEAWYAFFPDEIPKERLMAMAQAQAAANGQPVPQAQKRPPSQKTWPMPRR